MSPETEKIIGTTPKQLLIWDVDKPGHSQVTILSDDSASFQDRLNEGKTFFALNFSQFTLLSGLMSEAIKRREQQADALMWQKMGTWLFLNWSELGKLNCTKCHQRPVSYDDTRETEMLICAECNPHGPFPKPDFTTND